MIDLAPGSAWPQAPLATAIAANADLIVSGDRDLLDLGHFRETPIIDAAAATERIGGAAP